MNPLGPVRPFPLVDDVWFPSEDLGQLPNAPLAGRTMTARRDGNLQSHLIRQNFDAPGISPVIDLNGFRLIDGSGVFCHSGRSRKANPSAMTKYIKNFPFWIHLPNFLEKVIRRTQWSGESDSPVMNASGTLCIWLCLHFHLFRFGNLSFFRAGLASTSVTSRGLAVATALLRVTHQGNINSLGRRPAIPRGSWWSRQAWYESCLTYHFCNQLASSPLVIF